MTTGRSRLLLAGGLAATVVAAASVTACGSSSTEPKARTSAAVTSTPSGSPSPSSGPVLVAAPRPAHPTNGLIAYMVVNNPRANIEHNDVYIKRVDGSGVRRLTHNLDVGEVAWSPAGDWLAYVAYRDEGNSGELWAMRPDGSGAVRLDAAACCGIAWSPDATRIAYVDGGESLSVLDLRTGQSHRPAIPHRVSGVEDPRWSPDGRQIAYLGYARRFLGAPYLYVADAATGEQVSRLPGTANVAGLDWSWDTGEIVFATGGQQRGDYCVGDLFLTDLTGGPPRPFLAMPCVEADPQWSPDGRSVVFRNIGTSPGASSSDLDLGLWIADSDGTDPHLLVRQADGADWQPRG